MLKRLVTPSISRAEPDNQIATYLNIDATSGFAGVVFFLQNSFCSSAFAVPLKVSAMCMYLFRGMVAALTQQQATSPASPGAPLLYSRDPHDSIPTLQPLLLLAERPNCPVTRSTGPEANRSTPASKPIRAGVPGA